jgi:ribosomal protein L19
LFVQVFAGYTVTEKVVGVFVSFFVRRFKVNPCSITKLLKTFMPICKGAQLSRSRTR